MSTTLLVPVPEADAVLADWWPSWDPPRPPGIGAHVSICFPFLSRGRIDDHVLAELAAAAQTQQPFVARFDRFGRFPRTLFLAPDQPQPFVGLTEAALAPFPGTSPYRGAHDGAPVPHMTVVTTPRLDVLDRAEASVASVLPIIADVRELHLLRERKHGGWELLARFTLGS